MRSTPTLFVLAAHAALVLACSAQVGCAKPPIEPRYAPGVGQPATITVTSRSFSEGGRIPVDHTCDGDDVMPELVFSAPPEGTKSLVVYVEDPDTSNAPFTHMIAFNLSPAVTKLPAGADLAAAGEAARFGLNDFGAARYRGPCPAKGEARRYRYRVVALDTVLKLEEGATRTQVDAGVDGHILGEGAMVGQFAH